MAELTEGELDKSKTERGRRGPNLAAGLLVVALLAITVVGCASRVETVGNTAIWFWGDLQARKWDEAYGRLCAAEKERVSRDEFADTSGGRYSGLVSLQSGSGSWQQYRELDTLDSEITEAWTEVAGIRTGTTEVSRLNMVRQGGDWKVCGIDVTHLDHVAGIPLPHEADEMPGGPYG